MRINVIRKPVIIIIMMIIRIITIIIKEMRMILIRRGDENAPIDSAWRGQELLVADKCGQH